MRPTLQVVAQLRISVFRQWPYLYDGSVAYEQEYLEAYADCKHALVGIVWDGPRAVGATTAMPLSAADDAFRQPFSQAELDRCFYFGESVVLPAYRGRGLGHLFFDIREQAARQFGSERATFCAVVRDSDDPRVPAEYFEPAQLWKARGYEQHPDRIAHFDWREIGEDRELSHRLVFWSKSL